MKRIYLFCKLLIFVTVAGLVASCSNVEDIQVIPSITVRVNFPEGFLPSVKFDGEVILNNRYENIYYKAATDANGCAVFHHIVQGVYDISVSKELSNSEFKNIAPTLSSEVAGDITLTGITSGFRALGTEAVSCVQSLIWAVKSDIIFAKVYFATTQTPDRTKWANMDRYLTLYNNSDKPVNIDALCLGSVRQTLPANRPSYFYVNDKQHIYVDWLVRLVAPGQTRTMAPGETLLIAQQAQNHTFSVANSVDLTGADYELYPSMGRTPPDNPDVQNATTLYTQNAIGILVISNTNASFALFNLTDSEIASYERVAEPKSNGQGLSTNFSLKVPNAEVIDGIDCPSSGYDATMKRLHPIIDASFQNAAAAKTGIVLERRLSYVTRDGRIVLKDTNNSSQDLVQIPNPGDGTNAYLNPRIFTHSGSNE